MRLCPVCGAAKRTALHRQQFLDSPVCNGYDVTICSNCGAAFADGIPSQVEIDRYYTEQSKYAQADSGGAESHWDYKRFEAIAEQIGSYLASTDVKILDIGCATGGLLSVFRSRGYTNLTGVDPSPECARAAMKLHGVEVAVATIAQLGIWTERFDLILLVGVLEHIGDAKDAIRVIDRLLNPGGLIYCAVPDVEGLVECPNAPYQQFSVEHINFFSLRSLRNIFAACQFNAVRIWQSRIEWRECVLEPIASGLFKRGPGSQLVFDATTLPAINRYLKYSALAEKKIDTIIECLSASHEPVLVWGAGTLARRLLAASRLADINIVAFVDSNPKLQGGWLAGKPIWPPSNLYQRQESVLVCSGPFEREIVTILREKLKLRNRVILLR